MYCANVGDSRAVLCRGGRAIDLSRDHKAYSPQEMAIIVDSGGFIVNRRVMGQLAVGRAMGDANMKTGGRAVIPCDPEICACTLTPDDAFLLLACDGLFDVMSSQDAIDYIQAALAKGTDPDTICHNIATHAIDDLDSDDNVSVIIAVLTVSGGGSSAEAEPSALLGGTPGTIKEGPATTTASASKTAFKARAPPIVPSTKPSSAASVSFASASAASGATGATETSRPLSRKNSAMIARNWRQQAKRRASCTASEVQKPLPKRESSEYNDVVDAVVEDSVVVVNVGAGAEASGWAGAEANEDQEH